MCIEWNISFKNKMLDMNHNKWIVAFRFFVSQSLSRINDQIVDFPLGL